MSSPMPTPTFERPLSEAFTCKCCLKIDFASGRILSSGNSCTCHTALPIQTIFDLYGSVYYFMDSANLAAYETLLQTKEGLQLDYETNEAVKSVWGEHYRHYPYLVFSDKTLKPETLELFNRELLSLPPSGRTLLTFMNWLIFTDRYLGTMKEQLLKLERAWEWFPLETCRGQILFKQRSRLSCYLESKKLEPPADPNYLLLKNNIYHFYLVRSHYPYYEVRHIYLDDDNLAKKDVGGIRLGFIPGTISFEDYTWNLPDDADSSDEKWFQFAGIHKAGYEEALAGQFEAILSAEDPEFFLLPELSSPLSLQTKLAGKVRETRFSKVMSSNPHSLFMLMPGSFHTDGGSIDGQAQPSGVVYNHSRLFLGDGESAADVYKMNMYRFPADTNYKGALEPFHYHHGVEQNAFDRRVITIFETPLGRVAVFICVDLLNLNIEEVLFDRQVDLVFVMAMTNNPARGKFLRRMQELGERNGAVVVICNNLSSFDGKDRVVAYIPGLSEPYVSNEAAEVVTFDQMIDPILDKMNQKAAAKQD